MRLYKNYRKSQTALFGLTKMLKPTIRLCFVNKGIIYNLLWKAYKNLVNIDIFQMVKSSEFLKCYCLLIFKTFKNIIAIYFKMPMPCPVSKLVLLFTSHCLSDGYVYLYTQSPSESYLWMIIHLQLNFKRFGHKTKIFFPIDLAPPIVNFLHY